MRGYDDLRPYQHIAHDHLLEVKRCALWAGMGMGKSVSTLTALNTLYALGMSTPTLVLAPKRVAQTTWPDEVKSWSHLSGLSVMPIIGSEKERLMALKYDTPIHSINYENLPWLIDHFGERWPYRTVVSDESTKLKSFRGSVQTSAKGTTFIRAGGGMRSRALARIAHDKINRFIQLTGTPAPNGLIDLWGQAWFLDAGKRLGRTFQSFKDRWFKMGYDGFSIDPLANAQEEIQMRLSDICLTIDPKDWFDLKEPIVTPVYVDLPIKARGLYRQMEKEMYMELESMPVEAFNGAAKSQKLLQLSSGCVYVDPTADSDYHPRSREFKEVHDVKVQALDEIVEKSAGMPILVAYHFKSDLARLRRAFPSARELDDDPTTIKDWNAGKIPMLLSHPASAGHGLNLQHGGNIIVYFSHDWSLENRDQILERIGPVRQMQAGYDRPVFVYNIIARDTIDEDVLLRVATKRSVQDILLESMKRRRTR